MTEVQKKFLNSPEERDECCLVKRNYREKVAIERYSCASKYWLYIFQTELQFLLI